MQADDLRIGLGGLGADRERQPDAHRAERSGVEPVAGDKGRDRLAAVIEDLLPVGREDRLALDVTPASRVTTRCCYPRR